MKNLLEGQDVPPPRPRVRPGKEIDIRAKTPRRKDQSILTVVEQVSLQRPDGVPLVSVTRHSITKDGDAAAHAPPGIDVGPEWVRLDLAWLAEYPSALVVLANHEGVRFNRVPTPEQLAAMLRRVIDVYLVVGNDHPECEHNEPVAMVPPADSFRLRVPRGVGVWVRCVEATDRPARASFVAFP